MRRQDRDASARSLPRGRRSDRERPPGLALRYAPAPRRATRRRIGPGPRRKDAWSTKLDGQAHPRGHDLPFAPPGLEPVGPHGVENGFFVELVSRTGGFDRGVRDVPLLVDQDTALDLG